MTKKIGIIGSGVVGTAIGVILSQQGYDIAGVYDVNAESTAQQVDKTGCRIFSDPGQLSGSAEILFITVNDSSIGQVADALADSGSFQNGQIVIHMSGAHSAEILGKAREFGARVLSVHPLQSFANLEGAIKSLPGSVFSIQGDEAAYETAAELVKALGGEYFFIAGEAKPLYHAGACVVSNYLVTLIHLGAKLLEASGIPTGQSSRALMPLVRGTLSNIERMGITAALTGPIARGDIDTVVKHLECMQDLDEGMVELYRVLGFYTAPIARSKGTIDEARMAQFQDLFDPKPDRDDKHKQNNCKRGLDCG